MTDAEHWISEWLRTYIYNKLLCCLLHACIRIPVIDSMCIDRTSIVGTAVLQLYACTTRARARRARAAAKLINYFSAVCCTSVTF